MGAVPSLYRGTPESVVLKVGKIAMAGAALEDVVYSMAEAVALERARNGSGAKAAAAVRQRIEKGGLPPWAAPTRDSIAAWCSEAKGALTERNKVIHSIGYLVNQGGAGWEPVRRQTGSTPTPVSTDEARLWALRKRLDDLGARGINLQVSLLPMVAPGVYMHVWGPTPMSVVVRYEDGAYPALPDDREGIDVVLDRAWQWCGSLIRGQATAAIQRPSPEGKRLVPPWFGTIEEQLSLH